VRVRLLDGNAEAAAGAPGESVVSSSQLAAGYWGNRFQTDLAFQPDPDDPQLPVRVYRTGDSLRRGADGLYYFCGRVDSQVKIRGHRVEIGEIENAVLACDSALEAAVIFDAGAAPADQLIAIVRLDAHGTTDAVREHLRATLPAYMVPAHVIAIDQMPAGPTGKIDREAIRRIATGALAGRTVHDA
jgi:acyl-coenzyme A synthetase/AMP-(fatty) acid ligase